MQLAQRLYEGVDLGGESDRPDHLYANRRRADRARGRSPRSAAHGRAALWPANYVPPSPRQYKTKAKNAQEAHEAIRPTDFTQAAEKVARYLDADQAQALRADLEAHRREPDGIERRDRAHHRRDRRHRQGRHGLRPARHRLGDPLRRLPQALRGRPRRRGRTRTAPPAAAGAGRCAQRPQASRRSSISPSRRRAIPKRASSRRWKSSASAAPRPMPRRSTSCATATMCGSTRSGFIPEDKGRLVTAFLESFFKRYVEYDFTADLEEKLDLISAGELDWKDVLRDFWRDFIAAVQEIKESAHHRGARRAERMLGPHIFPARKPAAIRAPAHPATTGVSASSSASSAPSSAARTIPTAASPASSPMAATRPARLGSRRQAARHRSRDRPRRHAAHRPLRALCAARRATARRSRSAPRSPRAPTGTHRSRNGARAAVAAARDRCCIPRRGKPIIAGFGRFGPYVLHDGNYASLSSAEEVFTVGINRAVSLLAEKASGGRMRRGATGAQGSRRASRAQGRQYRC